MMNDKKFISGIMNIYNGKLKNYKEYDEKIIHTFSIENVLKEFENICKDFI